MSKERDHARNSYLRPYAFNAERMKILQRRRISTHLRLFHEFRNSEFLLKTESINQSISTVINSLTNPTLLLHPNSNSTALVTVRVRLYAIGNTQSLIIIIIYKILYYICGITLFSLPFPSYPKMLGVGVFPVSDGIIFL